MSLTEAESQAAVGVADAILGDFAKKGGYEHVPPVAEAARAAAEAPVAATPEVSSTPTPAAEAAEPATPAETPVAEIPSFEPDIPDDLQELLDTPDFDEEAAAEVAALVEEDPNQYIDTDQEKRIRALEKRNAWLEDQVVVKSRKNWVQENLRAYPLLRTYAQDEVEKIDATSRRGFAREAAALNSRLETIAKPMLADIAALKAGLKGEAYQEGKAEAKAAFGDPASELAATGPGADNAAKLAEAEKTGDLKQVFKVMLEAKPLT